MIFNVPNTISLIRIAGVPLFLWFLLGRDDPAWAGWILAIIGSTDWIDGYLARRLDQVTTFGKILDPVADRLAIGAALVGGLIAGVLPAWFGWLLLVREVVVGIGAVGLAAFSRRRVDVRYLGKMATFAVYGSVGSFYVFAGTGWTFFEWAAWLYGIPGLVLYYLVAAQYLMDVRAVGSGPTEQRKV